MVLGRQLLAFHRLLNELVQGAVDQRQFDLAGVDAPGRQEALHKVHHPCDGGADLLRLVDQEASFHRTLLALDALSGPVDDGKWRAELVAGHRHELALHGVDVLLLLQRLFQGRRLRRDLGRPLPDRLFQLVAIADEVLLGPLAQGDVGIAQHIAAIGERLRAHGQHLAALAFPLEAVGQAERRLFDTLAHHRFRIAIAPFAAARIVAQDILEPRTGGKSSGGMFIRS